MAQQHTGVRAIVSRVIRRPVLLLLALAALLTAALAAYCLTPAPTERVEEPRFWGTDGPFNVSDDAPSGNDVVVFIQEAHAPFYDSVPKSHFEWQCPLGSDGSIVVSAFLGKLICRYVQPIDPATADTAAPLTPWQHGLLGVSLTQEALGPFRTQRSLRLVCPVWVPPVLLGLYPFTWSIWYAWRRLRRARRGWCRRCGYDLAGNTTGVCSECGVAIRPERFAYPYLVLTLLVPLGLFALLSWRWTGEPYSPGPWLYSRGWYGFDMMDGAFHFSRGGEIAHSRDLGWYPTFRWPHWGGWVLTIPFWMPPLALGFVPVWLLIISPLRQRLRRACRHGRS